MYFFKARSLASVTSTITLNVSCFAGMPYSIFAKSKKLLGTKIEFIRSEKLITFPWYTAFLPFPETSSLMEKAPIIPLLTCGVPAACAIPKL